MLQFLFAVLLAFGALAGVVLQKTYFYMAPKELKRQARSDNYTAQLLYRAVAFGASLEVLLWLWIGITAALSFMLLARIAPPFFGFLFIVLLLWIAFAWLPSTRLTKWGVRLAGRATPIIVWILNHGHPALARSGKVLHHDIDHTQLYEREDLIELLDHQQKQADNRVSLEELEIAKRALSFSEYKVRDIVVPRGQVKTVSPDDVVNPVFVDEIHGMGHARFPVYDKKAKDIVGVLWLSKINQLTNIKKGGKVSDYMDKHVVYLHESDTLADALEVLYKTKQQLFVVVNSFEEYLGIVTLEDVLLQLIGYQAKGEFTQHDDKKAVAARHVHVAKAEKNEQSTSESDETVVE